MSRRRNGFATYDYELYGIGARIDRKNEIKFLYKDFDSKEIEKIEKERTEFLKEAAKKVVVHKMNPSIIDYQPIGKFSNILSNIMMNGSKMYKTESKAENYLLFMFCIDPDFEAMGLFLNEKDTEKFMQKLNERFGIASIELLKTEVAYIKSSYTKEEQKAFSKSLKKVKDN